MARSLALVLVALCLLALGFAPRAHAASSDTAALQVALRAVGTYTGSIDGVRGPLLRSAIRRFQRRKGLAVDGIAGPATRRRLGRRGRPGLGSRVLTVGRRGWDVAALQFLLVRRGCLGGGIDGGFGRATASAVRRCQGRLGLTVDGVAGRATIRALRSPRRAAAHRHVASTTAPGGPVRFLRPVAAPTGDLFGPRGGRPHHGVDFPALSGTAVTAGGVGTVRFAGWNTGGYGNLVVVTHRLGYESWYAHLASVSVSAGQAVSGGSILGGVGSTGRSTGPHLHFEVRRNGVPIDPLPLLLG